MKPEDQRLNSEQVRGMMQRIRLTRDREFDCSECRQHVGEYIERPAGSQPAGETFARVEHHLALCPECREEYHALLKIFQAGP